MVRYATIITDDGGREVVSAIGEFEGAAPQARLGLIEQVAPGVLIGMVRGGPVDAAGGFGFALGSLGGRDRAIGAARLTKRLRFGGRSGAAGSGAAGSEAAIPPSAIEAEACPTKPVRAASKPRKRVARSKSKVAKSKVAKSTAKRSARSKSKVVKSRTTTAETAGGEHG
ncbi:hypothetical protein [Mesorhizobium sangaii]|uniref:Uncharacterized protein n=1 Tax=Mesorhizobium sangaii TaxID=505389 RepID=A0A841PV43_9HYPH|nr:hypothetical protein [Mesorhizobium sangaii]MBB6412225.1 hypothetical protein [Mesorhizobium sangaii]